MGEGLKRSGRYRQPFFLFSVNNPFSMKKTIKSIQLLPQMFSDFTSVHKFTLQSDQKKN